MRTPALALLLLCGCGAPRPAIPAPDAAAAAGRAERAADAVRALAAGLRSDPTLAAKAAGVVAEAGPEGVAGAAQALAERDQQLDMELAQEPRERRAAKLAGARADDAALTTILASELSRLGPGAAPALLEQAAAQGQPLSELGRGALMAEVALTALGAMGEKAFPALVDSLRHAALRDAAAQAIARAGAPGRKLLQRMAGVPDPEIAAAAKRALKPAKRAR
jgi:hypothetical protein